MNINISFKSLVFATLFSTSYIANAGFILSAESLRNPLPAATGSPDAINDQSGLSSGFTSGVTDFNTYVSGNPTHADAGIAFPDTGYALFTTLPWNLDFDLGGLYSVTETVVWNWNGSAAAGINEFEIFSSTDATFSTLTSLGIYNLDPVSANNAIAEHQIVDFIDTTTQYIRFSVLTDHGFMAGIGVDEVAFHANNVSPVPVPAAAWLFGSGLMWLIGIRKKSSKLSETNA